MTLIPVFGSPIPVLLLELRPDFPTENEWNEMWGGWFSEAMIRNHWAVNVSPNQQKSICLKGILWTFDKTTSASLFPPCFLYLSLLIYFVVTGLCKQRRFQMANFVPFVWPLFKQGFFSAPHFRNFIVKLKTAPVLLKVQFRTLFVWVKNT